MRRNLKGDIAGFFLCGVRIFAHSILILPLLLASRAADADLMANSNIVIDGVLTSSTNVNSLDAFQALTMGGGNYQANAEASIASGTVILRGYSTASTLCCSYSTPYPSAGFASNTSSTYADTLTVSNPSVTGSGLLGVSINLQGETTAYSSNDGNPATAEADVYLCGTSCDKSVYGAVLAHFGNPQSAGNLSDIVNDTFFLGYVPFTWNHPFAFSISLATDAALYPNYNVLGSYSATSNFADTLGIASVFAEDSNGNIVSNSRITTGSGVYLPVPEPATLALMGTGLAVLGFARRRKKQAA